MRTLKNGEVLSNYTLGGDYPYWFRDDSGQVAWTLLADEAISALPVDRRILDPVAVLSMLCFGYICLDRTLMKGINRLPWFGAVDSSGAVSYSAPPQHGQQQTDPSLLAERLLAALREEIRQMCRGRERVWSLLSGGMDSRIVAGVIHEMQLSGEIESKAHAVTWGKEGCRDLVYAREIASLFGWEWHHAPMSAAHYWRNFSISAELLGAEISPCHVHRMDWFSGVPRGDLVVAASYGDSVGRAEFSSRHLAQLPALRPSERYGLIRRSALDAVMPQLRRDIWEIRSRYGSRTETGWREVELQAHYMRRLISHVLGLVNRWGSLRQALVSPATFGIMWAQAPRVRTNAVYLELLQRLNPDLLRIPWARTGRAYSAEPDAVQDQYSKDFHEYGLWLKRDLADKLEYLLFETGLQSLSILDTNQLHWMFKEWKRLKVDKYTGIGDRLSWVATLALFIKAYSPHLREDFSPRWFQVPANTAWKTWCRARQTRLRIVKPTSS